MTDDMMASRSPHAESPAPGKVELAPHPIAVTTHDSPCHIPGFGGTSLIFVFFIVLAGRRGPALPRSRRSVSLHEKEEKIGADRQGTSPAPGSWQQSSATNLDTLPATIMEFRRPDWTDGSRVWAAWPLGPLGDEGPLWIHSAEHAHRARCERGGSLVRQAPGHRSCLEPPQTLEPPSL